VIGADGIVMGTRVRLWILVIFIFLTRLNIVHHVLRVCSGATSAKCSTCGLGWRSNHREVSAHARSPNQLLIPTRSTAHDDIMNRPIWPKLYDGRAIIGESYKDFLDGVPLEENIAKYEAASKDDTSRRIVWA